MPSRFSRLEWSDAVSLWALFAVLTLFLTSVFWCSVEELGKLMHDTETYKKFLESLDEVRRLDKVLLQLSHEAEMFRQAFQNCSVSANDAIIAIGVHLACENIDQHLQCLLQDHFCLWNVRLLYLTWSGFHDLMSLYSLLSWCLCYFWTAAEKWVEQWLCWWIKYVTLPTMF
jgi:hypothetical protein